MRERAITHRSFFTRPQRVASDLDVSVRTIQRWRRKFAETGNVLPSVPTKTMKISVATSVTLVIAFKYFLPHLYLKELVQRTCISFW
jgi:hypothetical protein